MMPLQGGLSVERMCELAPASRAGFYRWLQMPVSVEEEMEVRSLIQQIAIEHRRRYGYRRFAAELRRRGMAVNHKRVVRIMREDNLLAVQPRQFVVTTKSDHKQRRASLVDMREGSGRSPKDIRAGPSSFQSCRRTALIRRSELAYRRKLQGPDCRRADMQAGAVMLPSVAVGSPDHSHRRQTS